MKHKIYHTINNLWAKLRRRRLLWDSMVTTCWNTLGRGIGLLIPFFIAAWFGVSGETDAFFFTYGLIFFLSDIFATVIETIIVPYIAEIRAQNGNVGEFISNILGISGLGLLTLVIGFLFIIKPFLSLVTRFDAKTLNLVYLLLMEISPLVILLVWTSVLVGSLNAYKQFSIPAMSPAFRALVNLVIIFLLKDKFGVHTIAFGYVAGEIVRLGILIGVIRRLNVFRLGLSFHLDSKIREFLKIASYQIIGMVAIDINPVIDKTMASWLGEGSVSILHYADRLYAIPSTFMSAGFMVALLSHWSSRYYEEGGQRLRKDLRETTKIVIPVALLVTTLLILFHHPVLKLALKRGVFDQTRVTEVGWVWICYLIGFTTAMLGRVYSRAHLTMKNTKVIMRYGFYSIFLNILLNYILMRFFKLPGIALSTSLCSLFYLFYLWRTFNIMRLDSALQLNQKFSD
ncbi:MAG: hypothetical protein K6U11_00795 [bacterium]|nr:hypothetical protein [bacterium]